MAANEIRNSSVDTMLEELYGEIMARRYKLHLIYMAGFKGLDEAQIATKTQDLSAEEMLLDRAQVNFDKNVRTHTLMHSYYKKTGRSNADSDSRILQELNDIKSSMPSIVNMVPAN